MRTRPRSPASSISAGGGHEAAEAVAEFRNGQAVAEPLVHRVPAIDRMVELLEQIERSPQGLTVNDLVDTSRIPRSTVYRILNTLESHGMVSHAAADGRYQLGFRFQSFAANVPNARLWQGLTEAARPYMQRLAGEFRETVKLSVVDGASVLCVAVVPGTSAYSVAAAVGSRYPMHAGAASKMLLQRLPPAAREAALNMPLAAYTETTLTDRRALNSELAKIGRAGWSIDLGEFSRSVHAVAVPVGDVAGGTLGAISICYLADRRDDDFAAMRKRLLELTGDLSSRLADAGAPAASALNRGPRPARARG